MQQFLWFDNNWQHHYCVYKLTSPDGLVYIGISRYSGPKRWKSGNGYKGNRRLDCDIHKYSFANFEKEIVAEDIYRDDAEKLEAELIEKYDATNPEKGYNVKRGGPKGNCDVYLLTFPDGKRYVGMTGGTVSSRIDYGSGYKHHPALREAIRRAGGIKNVKIEHFSYPLTRDSAERIETTLIRWFDTTDPEKGYNRGGGALAEKGWKHSEEVKEKISEALKGQTKSEETRSRMREAQEKRRVVCVDTGKVYDGVRIAAEELGISASGITRACRGEQKTAGGLAWRYDDGSEESEA